MRVYGFVDGNYLGSRARESAPELWVDPHAIVRVAVSNSRRWPGSRSGAVAQDVYRVSLYDALAELEEDQIPGLSDYLNQVELLDDCEVRPGAVKMGRRKQQKGVDVLLAVDMLVGAHNRMYDLAVLVAGDADFVPVVQEVRRNGCMVLIAASRETLSEELRQSADRVFELPDDLRGWSISK
jgi:uncharacterized LabA/DUF88 family protein